MFLLFSHELSTEQIQDAKDNLDVDEFDNFTLELKNIWANISPELETLVKNFMKIQKI